LDSVTQAALGAAVGGLVAGPRARWRGFAWGAAIGTLPDLDSLVSYGGPVADFTSHRGYSHALPVQTACAPLIAWPIYHLHRDAGSFGRWLALVWLILVTHALLDAVTIYGTRLWLPLSREAVGLGSIFIIDPLFTLPLLAGMLAAWITRRRPGCSTGCNAIGLALATAYVVATIAAQGTVEARARAAIADRDWTVERMLATPTPFNAVLWRIVAVGEHAYWEGFYTLGSGRAIRFTRYPREPALLAGLGDHPPVQRLRSFTDGFYGVEPRDGRVVITDLRMGQAGFYAFAFTIGAIRDEGVEPHTPERYRYTRPDWARVAGALYACARGRSTPLMAC